MTDALTLFQQQRPRLLALAYRLTGSRVDAEDLVQEAWLRWQPRSGDELAPAYLARIVVNLGIDRGRRLKREREGYGGTWLPEPWEESAVDPAEQHEQKRLLGTAWLVLMEKLNPLERAVFVLREALDYSFAEIAAVVARSEVYCRQIDSRARRALASDGLRAEDRHTEQLALLQRFLSALEGGELATINHLFSDDLRFYSDGGGKVVAVRRILTGLERVRALFTAVARRTPTGVVVDIRMLATGPALCYWRGNYLAGVTSIATAEGRITAIFTVRNPEKLIRITEAWTTPVTHAKSAAGGGLSI